MQVGITINITEYFPSDFDFTGFSFIFIYESRQIDKEITYLRKNNIYHKILLPNQRDIKFSIRMIRNDSLIGLSDFIIPSAVLTKKEKSYQKTCLIAITDSLKKLVFGSTNTNNSIKINVYSSIQYFGPLRDKSLRKNQSTINKDKSETKNTIRDKDKDKEKVPKSYRPTYSNSDLRNNSISIRNKSINNSNRNNLQKSTKNLKNQYSNPLPHTQINSPKNKSQYNFHNTEIKKIKKEKIKAVENANMSGKLNIEEEITDINIYDEDPNDRSRIDKDLEIEETNKDYQLFTFINDLMRENPLDELDNKKDVGEMLIYTRDIISQLLDYQIKFYESLKQSVDLNHKFNELLLKYNEKYRYIIKKMDKLKEEMNTHDMKNELIRNNNNYNNINEVIAIKNKELEIIKNIYKNQIEEDEINDINNKNLNKDLQLKILLNALFKISSKYGSINNLITTKNSSQNEITNLNQILNKYKEELNINEKKTTNTIKKENINLNIETNNNDISNESMDYVLSDNQDELDKLLNKHLKNICNNNRNISKVIFKRIGKNSYEYGNQKMIVKREDDNIKVRVGGLFMTLEKYLESNSSTMKKNLKSKKYSKKLVNKSK